MVLPCAGEGGGCRTERGFSVNGQAASLRPRGAYIEASNALTLSGVKLASLADFEAVFAEERIVNLDCGVSGMA
jgi:hypothetical protein